MRSDLSPSEIWAGEFLDHEWFHPGPAEPDPFPQPWLDHPESSRCFLFPRALLLEMAQGPRLALVSREVDYLAGLRSSLSTVGLREPLELVIDRAGRIVVREGHHRLLATESLAEFDRLPAYFTQSEGGIAVDSASAYDVLVPMLTSLRAS